jgi:hypothetical protein
MISACTELPRSMYLVTTSGIQGRFNLNNMPGTLHIATTSAIQDHRVLSRAPHNHIATTCRIHQSRLVDELIAPCLHTSPQPNSTSIEFQSRHRFHLHLGPTLSATSLLLMAASGCAYPGLAWTPSWALLGFPWFSWASLDSPGLSWALLGSPGLSWALLGSPELSRSFLGSPGLSWALLGS